jgi:putative membrane protein
MKIIKPIKQSVMRKLPLCALAFSLCMAGCNKDDNENMNQKDRDFITQASYINYGEVDAGNLATQHSADSSIIRFGKMMVADHSKAQNDLANVAYYYKASLPDGTDQKHTDMAAMLAMLQGDAFDSTYIYMMVEGHDEAIALYGDEVQNGLNEAVKQYAAETFVKIKQHRELADSIARALFP